MTSCGTNCRSAHSKQAICYVLGLGGQIKLDPSMHCPTHAQALPDCDVCRRDVYVLANSSLPPCFLPEFLNRPLPAISHGPLYLTSMRSALERADLSQSHVKCRCPRNNLWRRHSTQMQVKCALSLHHRCRALPCLGMYFRQLCLENRLAPRLPRLAVRPDASLQLK